MATSPSSSTPSTAKNWLIAVLIGAIVFLALEVKESNRQRDQALKAVQQLTDQMAATKPAVDATVDTVEAAAKTGKRVIGIMDGILDRVDPKKAK